MQPGVFLGDFKKIAILLLLLSLLHFTGWNCRLQHWRLGSPDPHRKGVTNKAILLLDRIWSCVALHKTFEDFKMRVLYLSSGITRRAVTSPLSWSLGLSAGVAREACLGSSFRCFTCLQFFEIQLLAGKEGIEIDDLATEIWRTSGCDFRRDLFGEIGIFLLGLHIKVGYPPKGMPLQEFCSRGRKLRASYVMVVDR